MVLDDGLIFRVTVALVFSITVVLSACKLHLGAGSTDLIWVVQVALFPLADSTLAVIIFEVSKLCFVVQLFELLTLLPFIVPLTPLV